MTPEQSSLDLAVIGNGTVGMLVDRQGRYVWGCLPHLAADPSFCALLEPTREGYGVCEIELEGQVSSEQRYLTNSAVLSTTLTAEDGSALEIIDFSPRFRRWDRLYHPVMFVRRIRPVAGVPRITVRVRPLSEWGAREPEYTTGSSHIRWVMKDMTLRLTSDIRVPFIEQELPFVLDRPVNMVLGPDESLTSSVDSFAREAYDRTLDYWQSWTRSLSIPFEWQDAVIRAAITLKLCQYEGTGAIVAALTTSLPEAPDTGRNWDYRYCWLRDAAFVVRTLNQLGATKSMEDFLGYIYTLASGSEMQPVYGIHFEQALTENVEEHLRGYRGQAPVRNGNDAYLQKQHDVYGSVVMASTHLFFDQRLTTPGDVRAFEQLERSGDLAYSVFDQPDAGLWEFRGRQGVHTYSSVMCWVAADRLAKIALQLGYRDRAAHWRSRADVMREKILREAYSQETGAFMETWGGSRLDASTLALADLGFIAPDDERFLGTLDAVEKQLKRGNYLFRYVDADDFGEPLTSFNLCNFWYMDALARVGRKDEARELFEHILSRRNHLGLLSEDLHPDTGESWGNFPQTYSMLGIIMIAMRLSQPWELAS
ncbi:MAG TPA: glycoside hydrolase family 15 protein [Actinomycetes bacterium]|nr:glycoside hydrolase family 15 protein [Actinomycetes bacterium]